MLERIRRRSILFAMLAIIIVMVVILGGINLVNIKSTRDYSDAVLEVIAKNEGFFPFDFKANRRDSFIGIDVSEETPYDTRYFFVKYDTNGSVIDVNTMNIRGVDNNSARYYAYKVVNSGKESGNIDDYRYLVYDNDTGKIVVFIDYSRQTATIKSFERTCLIFALSALIAVFLLLFLFSSRLLKPIENSFAKQKSFITDASHELKTPMAIISANNEILEMDYGDNECTTAISKQVTRMANMTRNLTALAKVDNIDALAERKNLDISQLIKDIAEPYFAMTGIKDIQFNLNLADNVEMYGDEGLMRQMVSLILDNAIKYGKKNVDISTKVIKKKLKTQVELVFKNDTDEIEQGNLNKYFNRFYRSEASRASGIEGSGIGLSIVKEIVELHHGTISCVGEGNNFIISIVFVERYSNNKPINRIRYNYKNKKKNK